MKILSLDSTAIVSTVAITENEKLLAEFSINNGNTHSETLLPMIEASLKVLKLTVDDIDLFACSAGPGSFTGVRIGVAAAKGFAWGNEIPIFGVSTLEAMALGLGIYDGYVCPVMDARRAQVYNALFYVNQGVLTRITPDRAIALADLEAELKALDKSVFLVGDGSILTYNTLHDAVPALVLPPQHKQHQRAVGVALAALRQETPDAPEALAPNYLRLSQAERERNEKMNAT